MFFQAIDCVVIQSGGRDLKARSDGEEGGRSEGGRLKSEGG